MAKNPHRTLTFEQAQEIRRKHSRFIASVRELAREYGVSKTLIHNIIKGDIYKEA